MSLTISDRQETSAVVQESGFDVLDIVLVLARGWRWIAGMAGGLASLVLLSTFAMQTKYSATVTFLIDQDSGSTGLMLFRQNDPTISLLQSRAITEFVLRHIDAAGFAQERRINLSNSNAGIALASSIHDEVDAMKNDQGVYMVTVQDPKPARAVAIANAYLDALRDLSNRMSLESAAETRVFYQQQIDIERAALEKAQAAEIASQAKTGLLQPTSQVGLEISQINAYRAQVVGLEVQRANTSQSSTAENPEMVRLNAQIGELNSKIAALQAKINNTGNTGLPSQTLETTNLQREVTFHEAQLTAMGTQLQRARLQENFSIPKVHVVDRAMLPIPKTSPKRLLMTLIAAAVGAFLGTIVVVCLQMLRRLRRDPESSQKLSAIKHSFWRQQA